MIFFCRHLLTHKSFCFLVLQNTAMNNALSINASVHAGSSHAICQGPCHDVKYKYEQSLTLVNVPYLCRSASRGGVSNSPCCLLPCTKLSLLKDLNEYREDVGINHILTEEEMLSATQTQNKPLSRGHTTPRWSSLYLNLSSVSCCDVGHSPASLLLDGLLGTAEEVE